MTILGIAATVLGVGGVAGVALRFLAPGAFAMVAAFLKGLSPRAWLAIGAVVLLVGGYFVHQHRAHKALDAAYAKGSSDRDKAWQKRFGDMHAEALQWKAKADAAAAKITQEERTRHDEDLRSIAARADDQRLRGPGKAAAPACVGHVDPARLSGGAGGHVAAARPADAGVDRMPADEGLAIVSWDDLVAWAADHDALRSEVMAWRLWHPREAEAYDKARTTPPKP